MCPGWTWPTVTALLFALQETLGHWPLALRTFVLTGLMVPSMSILIIPALTRLLEHFPNKRRTP